MYATKVESPLSLIVRLDSGAIAVSPIATFPLLTTFNCAFVVEQKINNNKEITVFFMISSFS